MKMSEDITEAMTRVDRAAGKILDRNWPKAPPPQSAAYVACGGSCRRRIDQAARDQQEDELLRATLSLLNKIRRS
jgi:hypothetical protein